MGSLAFVLALASVPFYAQDLSPRAYVIMPTGTHAIIFASSFNRGDVLIDPTLPIEDLKSSFQVPMLGYYQSFGLLGRSSNLNVLLPYGHGSYSGTVDGSSRQVNRSGLGDMRVRFAVNLKGGRAMSLGDYAKWNEKKLIGASLTVLVPTGQYDPARLINNGSNRWGFKPEVGFSRRWSHWVADWYFGAWFFTPNNHFFPGANVRKQQPIGSIEGHLGYYIKPRFWVSLDGNFWIGSRSSINGIQNQDQQRNSRIGATASFPINRHHAVKFSYSQGAYVMRGGDFRTISVAWQYSWFSRPR